MQQFQVTGMSCAACSARVEKAVSAVKGVESVSVSLLTNSMGVEGSASNQEIIQAVVDAGYGASVKGQEQTPKKDSLADTETPKMLKRFVASLLLLLVLMYCSMGYKMAGFPLPDFFDQNYIAIGLIQLLLAGLIMVINQKFFINGWKGLLHRSPNMDTLVSMGSGVSFLYSVYALFRMTQAQVLNDADAVLKWWGEFYFESAAMILTLILIGKMLEARAKGKTTNALKSLMDLSPKTATLLQDEKEIVVPVEQVKKGDIFVVRPGEQISVDARILEGNSAVEESALTGESIPIDKTVGDSVSAGTMNQSGFLKCEATAVGQDTALSKIIQMVSDAAATKAPIAKIADRVSGVFVPIVLGIALITFIIWLLVGQTFSFALTRGISVLVISCPCALGLATPVAIMVGNGVGAKNGVLFKTAVSLEQTGKAQIVLLDKTGTVTNGTPVVTDVIPFEMTEQELLQYAVSLEEKSEHPLAKAVRNYGAEREILVKTVEEFQIQAGNGLKGLYEGNELYGGNATYIQRNLTIPKAILEQAEQGAGEGKTPLFFGTKDRFLGMILVADTIKEESAEAIRQLKNMGLSVVMVTGDNKRTAQAVAKQAGIDQVVAGVTPDKKEAVVRKMSEFGKVIMVGDGINDSPALTRADVGIAIGTGTDVAIDAADVVLMKSKLTDVPAAIRLSRKTLRNIRENLFWAFFYNIIGIPLAAGAYIALFGWKLSPMFGAAAMSLSSFCVVTNALRLNFCKIYQKDRDKKIHPVVVDLESVWKEEETMELTIQVKGMMCPHCEAMVKKTCEAFEEVDEATASHTEGTVVLKLNREPNLDAIKAAIVDKGYEVE